MNKLFTYPQPVDNTRSIVVTEYPADIRNLPFGKSTRYERGVASYGLDVRSKAHELDGPSRFAAYAQQFVKAMFLEGVQGAYVFFGLPMLDCVAFRQVISR